MKNQRNIFVLSMLSLLTACQSSSSSNNSNTTSDLPQFYQDFYATQATSYTGYDSGACSFGAQTDTNVTAINASLYNNASLCGAYIEVTGDKGTAIVKVIDVCPSSTYCDNNHLDLSTSAYSAVTTVDGVTNINWKFIEAPLGDNPIKIHWGGVNGWFMDLVVDVHRHPVSTVEVQDSTASFIPLTRNASNHFQLSSGSSAFPNPIVIRITDMFGHQVQDTVSWSPDTTSMTTVQFPAY